MLIYKFNLHAHGQLYTVTNVKGIETSHLNIGSVHNRNLIGSVEMCCPYQRNIRDRNTFVLQG